MNSTKIFEDLFSNVTIGIFLYIAGFLTNELWDIINRKNTEDKLKRNTRLALKAIYEAEKEVKGEGLGIDKLEFATKKYMKDARIKRYKQAQAKIIQVFNLTRLSENSNNNK